MIIQLGEEKTEPRRVIGYEDQTGDLNIIHRDGGRILPGMFYSALVAPHLTKPIKSIELSFTGFRRYPNAFELEIDEDSAGARFLFRDSRGVSCKGEAQYDDGMKLQNSHLEEFAHILDVNGDYQSLSQLWLLGKIPGQLVRKLSANLGLNQRGVYLRQSLDFSQTPDNDNPELVLSYDAGKKGKMIKVNTIYSSSGKTCACGRALVGISNSEELEQIIRDSEPVAA